MAGGKGASLARMAAAGLPVPRGFVVCTSAFQSFLETHGEPGSCTSSRVTSTCTILGP